MSIENVLLEKSSDSDTTNTAKDILLLQQKAYTKNNTARETEICTDAANASTNFWGKNLKYLSKINIRKSHQSDFL